MRVRGAFVIALAACNQLEGIGVPTLVPDAADAPSCATGWSERVPIAIENDAGTPLVDYQVQIHLDTAAWIAAGELRPDGGDLRFTAGTGEVALPYAIDRGLGTADTIVWVAVPEIPVGSSSLIAYHGNPTATAPTTGSPFVQGVIDNGSFEEVGAWTLGTAVGSPATIALGDTAWHSSGDASLYIDLETQDVYRPDLTFSTLSQPVTFPDGAEYVLRFDVNVIAASHWVPTTKIGDSNDGGFAIAIGDTGVNPSFEVWTLIGDTGNITGLQLDLESQPISAGTATLTLIASANAGSDYGYAKGYFDNVRVRKHVSPEPGTTVLSTEPCAN